MLGQAIGAYPSDDRRPTVAGRLYSIKDLVRSILQRVEYEREPADINTVGESTRSAKCPGLDGY